MENTTELLSKLPQEAKDLRVNMKNVLQSDFLSTEQAWGIALASAYFTRCKPLIEALKADAAEAVPASVLEDAKASAAIMGMNTVYYRFRHLMSSEEYNQRPAKLRMQRMMQPSTSKVDFELNSMACAALAGCEMCLKAHEQTILKGGLSADHVHDSVRVASVVSGVAVALETVE